MLLVSSYFFCSAEWGSASQMCTPHTIYGVVTLFNTLHVVFRIFLEFFFISGAFERILLHLDLTWT